MPEGTCSVDGCEVPARSRGWCSSHYMNWWRRGDPLVFAQRATTAERFWAKVDRRGLSECWEWQAAIGPHGYGRLRYDGDNRLAHRLSWSLANGRPAPDDQVVMHTCDNPPCCNPEHLVLGTQVENIEDMVKKGRHWRANVTHCIHGHEFTPENTAYTKRGHRRCRACRQEREWGTGRDRLSDRQSTQAESVP